MKAVKILVGVACIFGSICCNISVFGSPEEEFKTYLKAIPSINLPLKINCGNGLTPAPIIIEDRLIDRFGISKALVYGKLKTSDRYSVVVYLLPASQYVPVVKITDNSGNPLDTLYLLGNCGVNDECMYANSFASITPDLVISTIDTVRTCVLDTLDRPKPGSEKLKVENRSFFINESGRVVERR